jgi:predicted acyltransferase
MSEVEPVQPVNQRIESIDVLRGFDMFWIIGGGAIFASLHKVFKNDITGTIKQQLEHVPWEGFRFEDLIMPLFMFIVGVVMPYSFARRLDRGHGRGRLFGHVLFRGAVLFVLGMVAQGRLLELDLSRLHIYCNTLQAIAAGYVIAAAVLLTLRPAGQAIVCLLLMLVFWGLMALVPAPGSTAGDLTPDGNLAICIDRLILGRFQDQTHYTWILSSLTFGSTVLMGVLAGHWLRSGRSGLAKAAVLVAAGGVCVGIGWGWGMVFPIIKHLWTSSFVMFSGGICLVLMGLFYLIIDVFGLRRWAFGFKVIGMNAIFVYMITHLWSFRNLGGVFVKGFDKWLGPWDTLVHSIAGFALVWLILAYMYRKQTFLKI